MCMYTPRVCILDFILILGSILKTIVENNSSILTIRNTSGLLKVKTKELISNLLISNSTIAASKHKTEQNLVTLVSNLTLGASFLFYH